MISRGLNNIEGKKKRKFRRRKREKKNLFSHAFFLIKKKNLGEPK